MGKFQLKIIAELCQNHNGDVDLLFKMVEEASKSGATHVKLQHIFVDNLTFRPEFETGGLNPVSKTNYIERPYAAEYARLKKLEISNNICSKFVKFCQGLNVVPLTTCLATEHADIVSDIGFSEVKIASYDCASPYLLEAVRKKFNHIYVSTGATFDSEVRNAACILENDFSFLHTFPNTFSIQPPLLTRLNDQQN